MTVVDVTQDRTARTLTLVAEYPAGREAVWRLWADPRVLERWWGPPTYPATVQEHDLTPGGRVTYYMTGPQGDRHHGWWAVTAAEAPARLAFDDGFADADGVPSGDLPVAHIEVTLDAVDAGTRMVVTTSFPSDDAMDRLLAMGMAEGMTEAFGQTDGLLEAATPA